MAPVNFGYILLWSVSLSSAVALPSNSKGSVEKRQLLGLPALPGLGGAVPVASAPAASPSPSRAPGSAAPAAPAPVAGLLGGVTNSLPIVGGSSSPLGAVTGALPALGGSSSPLGAVTGAVGSVPGVGSVLGGSSSPLGGVTGALAPVTGALAPVTGAVSGAVNTASNALGSIPGVGPAVGSALNTVTSAAGGAPAAGAPVPNLNPATITGIPGTDPVGAFSISVIATLLSLLKKDPMSLFAPSLAVPALVKRDVPHLADREMEERMLAKRQLPGLGLPGLPSLSSGIPGVGVGSLPSSGIPGVSPDLAFLVGSIAKNIAIPGGNGLGSVTGSILSVLNGVVPNFLFQLPVVQDSVSTFGVLQLLASINPGKFSALASLNSLPALSQAAASIPAGDLAFIKTLPLNSDPSNLITTITGLTDNILTLPGNVGNLKASVAALSLRNLGLSVPGL